MPNKKRALTIGGQVLKRLLKGERLTRYDSRIATGTESLHSVISHLRNDKHYPIESRWVSRLDAIVQVKAVKLYWMRELPPAAWRKVKAIKAGR